ncbi:putative alkane 1-monooxygenase [Helianthus debilis subsp. tardiflorus]
MEFPIPMVSYGRSTARSFFSILKHPRFQSKMETFIWNKVENGLLPILESICRSGTEIDLQYILQRFAFDTVCTLLFDNDPESLSLDFPYIPYSKAFTDGEEACLGMLLPHSFGNYNKFLEWEK